MIGNRQAYKPVIIAPPELPPPADSLALIDRLAGQSWLAAPPVGLPDLHLKAGLETPSSLVTALEQAWVLGLTSPSPGCGMTLALTGLEASFLTRARLDQFFDMLAVRLAPRRSEPAISDRTLDEILLGGMRAAQALAPEVTLATTTACHDAAFPAEELIRDYESMAQIIPDWLRHIARREFRSVGLGNHFLELQAVSEILDPAFAAACGVNPGQIAVLVHADSGHLGAILGRLFAHRQKQSRGGRWSEWHAKIGYHRRRAASFPDLLGRLRLFWPGRWVPLQVGSTVWWHCRWALGMATNYAAANRLAVMGEALRALTALGPSTRLRLLWDAPHNGISAEPIAGQVKWVHRHNAACVRAGLPMLLPGTHRVTSLLCAGGNNAETALNSAPHGAGTAAERLGSTLGTNGHSTLVYGYDKGPARRIPHLSDTGVDAVARVLAEHDIARPVARFRPIATLKDIGN